MKRLTFLVFLILSIFTFQAQDVIVMRNGDVINAIVSEITQTEVKYKKASRPEGPLYTVNKSDVLAINYGDGEKETFDAVTVSPYGGNFKARPVLNQDSIDEINRNFIARINKNDIEYRNEKVKNKNKETNVALSQYFIGDGSVFNDGILDVSFNFGSAIFEKEKFSEAISSPYKADAFQPVISNFSDQIIYIDLANTFFVENSETTPYYIPTSTAISGTKTSGASVNLGAVAGALGVGGTVGALANGVNVGGSNSNSVQTVTYSQRILSIPPHSSIKLDWKPYIPVHTRYVSHNTSHCERDFWGKYSNLSLLVLGLKKNDKFCEGTVNEFDEMNSPHKCKFYLTYSLSEDFSNTYSMSQSWYMRKIIGAGDPWWKFSNHTNNFGEFSESLWWTYMRCTK